MMRLLFVDERMQHISYLTQFLSPLCIHENNNNFIANLHLNVVLSIVAKDYYYKFICGSRLT